MKTAMEVPQINTPFINDWVLNNLQKVYDAVNPRIQQLFEKESSIFLIGASLKRKDSLRRLIQEQLLTSYRFSERINIYYPEEIFEEQIFQRNSDMLSLENMLAESVHAVVMCIESPGSIAELGAFANHSLLKDKLIVYLNENYKKDNSFIRIGPVKYLDQKTHSKVNWRAFDRFDSKDKMDLIKQIREIKKNTTIKMNLENPLYSERFLTTLLYVLGTCNSTNIVNIVKRLNIQYTNGESTKENTITIVRSSISMLLKRKEIELFSSDYRLTQKGYWKLISEFDGKFVHQYIDSIRVDMINYLLRKKWNRWSS